MNLQERDERLDATIPFLAVVRILGILVACFSLTFLIPIGFGIAKEEPALIAFQEAFIVTLVSGLLVLGLSWWHKRELQPRDGFLLVAMVWLVLPVFAAIPFYRFLPELNFAQAYFEAVSGLTTTGSTVLVGLDEMPRSILIWRAFLQWLGGMGILILAVAILPLLGVGGMQIYRAESAGPIKDAKLTPRIAETAKLLYSTYFLLSLACFFSYWVAGMDWFDALIHMGGTMSLGGLSSHDASFGYFDSPLIEAIAIFFMLIAGVNFVVHAVAIKKGSLGVYWQDAQAKWFWFTVLAGSLVVWVFLYTSDTYPTWSESLRHALFNTVSIATTTGFATEDYAQWGPFAGWFMIFLSVFATSAGSTGGGIKMIRLITLIKQARRELMRIIHPRLIDPVQIEGAIVENRVIFAVLAYMLFYGATVMIASFLLLLSGMDPITAVSATLASVNNVGPGLGEVGPASNYAGLSEFQLWVCSAAMLLGRLELLTLLVVLMPSFWKD